MNPRAAYLACLEQQPPALFEAALWIAVEHQPALQPDEWLQRLNDLQQQVSQGLPNLPPQDLAQALLRKLNELGFHEDDEYPLRPRAALLDQLLARRRGQPLSLALLALELAKRLGIALQGVNFPGHFLLRVPGADHLLDPCNGRRLYPRECRELLQRHLGPNAELDASQLQACDAHSMLQRLSRNLRQLHQLADDPLAALRDAERVLQLGTPTLHDHLARADIYQQLDCPQGERFDLEHALLLSDDPTQRLQLSQRLRSLNTSPALH
jgi:regulator of sirC expression with transglutaminase-like and TPR domain